MTTKRITTTSVAQDLAKHEIQCAERWKTAFNEFADIKQEISNINNTMKTAIFGVFGFIGALGIAIVTTLLI